MNHNHSRLHRHDSALNKQRRFGNKIKVLREAQGGAGSFQCKLNAQYPSLWSRCSHHLPGSLGAGWGKSPLGHAQAHSLCWDEQPLRRSTPGYLAGCPGSVPTRKNWPVRSKSGCSSNHLKTKRLPKTQDVNMHSHACTGFHRIELSFCLFRLISVWPLSCLFVQFHDCHSKHLLVEVLAAALVDRLLSELFMLGFHFLWSEAHGVQKACSI